jgi:hypothetical protein
MWQRAVMGAQPRCRCGRAGGTVPYGYALMAAVSVGAHPCHICTGTWLGLTHKRRRRRSGPQRQCRRLQKRRTRPAIRTRGACVPNTRARARAPTNATCCPPWVAERGTGGWAGLGCTAKAHCAHVDDRRHDSACGCGCGGGTFERHTACCMLHATPYAHFFFFCGERTILTIACENTCRCAVLYVRSSACAVGRLRGVH